MNRKILFFSAVLLFVSFSGCSINKPPEGVSLQLGTRIFSITDSTVHGTPIIHLWKAQMPTGDSLDAAGFPVLEEAQHHIVWQPSSLDEGAYNHYPALFFHNGHFYAMWSNHWHGEDGPGQRVMFSKSTDAINWTQGIELFPSPGPVLPANQSGIHLKSDRWVEVNGKLYAVVFVFPGSYPIAREVTSDDTLSDPFLVCDPGNNEIPVYMSGRNVPALATEINKWYSENDAISWWSYNARTAGERLPLSTGVDGARLLESFSFRSKDGMVAFFRDYSSLTSGIDLTGSNRIYASFSDGKGRWSAAYPTDIPDSHSRAHALTLPNRSILLVGNQIAPRFDAGLYLRRDPLTLAVSLNGEYFTKVFALRSGALPNIRFSGITGRVYGQFSYPSMIIHDGIIYVLYSINKEDIAITSIPLSSVQ